MENLIEIVKEAANCKGFNLSVMDSEYGNTKAREIGFYLLKAAASGLTSETFLILTFIKL